MEFVSSAEKVYMIGPSGERIEQIIEHRVDPLDSSVCTINSFLGEKARTFLGNADLELLKRLEEESKSECPFCTVMEKGTRFLPEFIEKGYISAGNSVAVPNLFAKAGFDAVIVVNFKSHKLFPSEIADSDIANAIKVGMEFIIRARSHDPLSIHHVIGMNFLHPGGSSVPHPHFQAQVRRIPYSRISRLVNISKDYYDKHRRSYWSELIEKESSEGKRYIGKTGDVHWLVPFAPSHQKEVWGIYLGKGSFFDAPYDVAEDFGSGISRVISFYEEEGHYAFTFSFLSSPEEGSGGYFPLQVRLAARPAFKALYANYDTWFLPKMIGDEVLIVSPEEYAERLREIF